MESRTSRARTSPTEIDARHDELQRAAKWCDTRVMSLFECHGCRRHISITEVHCPFCAAKPATVEAPLGLGTLIFALGLSLAACGGKSEDTEADSTEATGSDSSSSTDATTSDTTTDESDDGATAYTVSGSEWDSEESAGTTDESTTTEESDDGGTAYTVSGSEWESEDSGGTTDESTDSGSTDGGTDSSG
jgi:hypothetical protein